MKRNEIEEEIKWKNEISVVKDKKREEKIYLVNFFSLKLVLCLVGDVTQNGKTQTRRQREEGQHTRFCHFFRLDNILYFL